MNKQQEKVWEILTSDEQTAVTLSLSHNKSSWEVGEIMGKSHYKYLEIAARAKRFFKLFSEYFSLHDDLFPEGLRVEESFQEYIEGCIIKRLTPKDVNQKIFDHRYGDFKTRQQELILRMNNLKSHALGRDLHDLIIEFDRWNNYRILPESLQEPSAFKRRNKTREKNRIKLVSRLPELTIKLIISKYRNKSAKSKLYLPLVTEAYQHGFIIIPVKNYVTTITGITALGLPLFKEKSVAREYAILIAEFVEARKNSCRTGLRFWPEYRVISQKAINYTKLEHIRVNRRFYEHVFDNDMQKVKKQRQKIDHIKGEKPVDEATIWQNKQ
jgi:hypothetical protein